MDFLEHKLNKRRETDTLRSLKVGNYCTDFFSNDYLGLASNDALWQNIHEALSLHPNKNGATGSRLISGNSELMERTESELKTFFQSESSLLFPSGYMANLAVFSSIPQKNDLVLYDELAHACIKDGIRLGMAAKMPFKHNDLDSLERKINQFSGGELFVAVESVYSMDGDQAPLEELIALKKQYDFHLIVDEAHSTGIYGNGRGLMVEKNLHHEALGIIYTFGKGMGIHGASVAGSHVMKDYLINFARPFIYTTGMAPHQVISIREAFRFLDKHPELIQQLWHTISGFHDQADNIPGLTTNQSPIQCWLNPDIQVLQKISAELQNSKVGIKPIYSPTVPKGKERLRICLHNFNTFEEINQLLDTIKRYG